MLLYLAEDGLDASLFLSACFANKKLVGNGSGRVRRWRLAYVLECTTGNHAMVKFGIAAYLWFDERTLHGMFANIDIFNG